MQNKVWYNRNVPSTSEKKTVQIAVKLSESLHATLGKICAEEDRPVGYVARELMVRGLALYKLDGRLRGDPITGSANGIPMTTIEISDEQQEAKTANK